MSPPFMGLCRLILFALHEPGKLCRMLVLTCCKGYGFILGFFIDRMGIRVSLILGTSIAVVGKVMIFFARAPWIVYMAIFLVVPLGEALCIPVLLMSVKR